MPPSQTTSLRASLPGLRRTVTHLRPHLRQERRLLVTGLVTLVAEVLLRVLEPWPLKYVIDAVVSANGAQLRTEQPAGVGTVILVASLALLAIVAVRAGTEYLMTLCFALAGNRLLTRVRADAYAHMQTLSMSFHDKARTGDLVTRVTSDVGRLKEVAVTAALPLVGNIATMAGMLVVVAVLDWQLALLMMTVLPVFFVTGTRLARRINTVSRTQRKAEGALASLATETLSAMRVVQSYSLQSQMQEQFSRSNTRTLKDGVKAKKLSAGLERKTDVLVALATSLVLYFGARRVVTGELTPGELVVFLTYLKSALKPMRDLAKYTGRIAQAAASGERLVDVLDEVPTVRDNASARPAHPFRGQLEFRDVWLSYEPDVPVLRGLSLEIQPGERVAVVGPSGAGKSSLAMLVSRLRDPDAGVVRIDGQDLRELTLESVRTQIAIVLQESLLFATTIRDNIAHGLPGATQEQVEDAARLAGAHEFVLALPQGYDTVVGERGATLSGGQRQRIAIARAAIRDAPIVILDEAMSGLDVATERAVVEALRRLTQDRTTLVITHDLNAAADCDRVIWVEEGRVVADEAMPPVADPSGSSGRRRSTHVVG